jgi:hypothetical protein
MSIGPLFDLECTQVYVKRTKFTQKQWWKEVRARVYRSDRYNGVENVGAGEEGERDVISSATC